MGVLRPKEIKREIAAIGLAYGVVVLIVALAFAVKAYQGDLISFGGLASIESPSQHDNPYPYPSGD